MKIRKGDNVFIQRGKDKNKTGKVLAVFPREERVVVEGVNVRKRHVRPRKTGEKGQIIEVPARFPSSSVSLICPSCKKAVRVRSRHDEKTVSRICIKCSFTF